MTAPQKATESTPETAARKRLIHRLQALSGVVFSLFLVLHLLTTSAASAGNAAYDRVLAILRAIYRPHPLVELALVGIPAAIHITCALLRIIERRRAHVAAPSQPTMRVHRYSGYVLLLAFAGHVFATRFAPLFATGPTATGKADFSFLAFSLTKFPAFFIPYYLALGAAGALHLFIGLGLAAKILFPSQFNTRRARSVSWVFAGAFASAVVAGVSSMALHAASADPTRLSEWTALYQRYVPFAEAGH